MSVLSLKCVKIVKCDVVRNFERYPSLQPNFNWLNIPVLIPKSNKTHSKTKTDQKCHWLSTHTIKKLLRQTPIICCSFWHFSEIGRKSVKKTVISRESLTDVSSERCNTFFPFRMRIHLCYNSINSNFMNCVVSTHTSTSGKTHFYDVETHKQKKKQV